MIGYIVGSVCGAIELLLLHLLVNGISTGSIKVWVVFAKIAVLAVFLLPCALWAPDELYRAGVAAAAVLVVGSVFMSAATMKKVSGRSDAEPRSKGDAI